MRPILYTSQETAFTSNGIGILTDAVSCTVTEERNGAFELEMTYPVTGIHYKEIKARCLIMARPNPVDDPQPFRVYRITKPMGGMVTVYGEHISYDLSGIPVSPFTATNAADAMQKLKSSSAVANPFSFWTDKSTTATMKAATPAPLRSLLGGREGSVLDVYGGEYKWDRYTVRLYGQRGENRGVSIRYGKNLTDLEQDENVAGVYTGVYPYWASMEGALVQLPEKILNAPGTYDFTRIMALDLSSDFQEAPTVAQLRARAESYIKANKIGVPKVSLSISFVPLEQTEEYKDLALLERVELCDTVNVEFPALGVSATAKCVKTTYDVLLDRYISVELGDARTNIADTIAAQQQKIEQAPTITAMKQAVDSATGQITGNKGGYVVLHSSTGGKEPDEILIMDTPDIKTAKKVWRWNKAGLGYSSRGYNGPYGLAMTQNGAIVADFITAGTLTANIIKSGILQSLNKVTSLDMLDGTIQIKTGTKTNLFINNFGIAFYDDNSSGGSDIVGAFGIADDGQCGITLYNRTKSKSYEPAGEFSVDKNGKSRILINNGIIESLVVGAMLAAGWINSNSGFRLTDENNNVIGNFGITTEGARLETANISIIKNGKIIGFFSTSGNSDISVLMAGQAAINACWTTQIIIEDDDGNERGKWVTKGATSEITADVVKSRSISTTSLYTDNFTYDGNIVYPSSIQDKDGNWVRVLRV